MSPNVMKPPSSGKGLLSKATFMEIRILEIWPNTIKEASFSTGSFPDIHIFQ